MTKEENPLLGTSSTCQFCGKDFIYHWGRETNDRLAYYGMCFQCDHWLQHYLADNNGNARRAFVARRVHYSIGPESRDPPHARGFGGARFKIRLIGDGTFVESTNVWCQGRISGPWLPMFPDTAQLSE